MSRVNFQEKRDIKRDWIEKMEIKTKQDAANFFERSRSMTDCIPMGQPILVGHHSERSHRRLLERSWNMLGKAFQTKNKAHYWKLRLEGMDYYDRCVISSDDPDRLEKLKDKLYGLTVYQEKMKAINKIIKSKKKSEAEKYEEISSTFGYSIQQIDSIMSPDFAGRIGFASYRLTNNGATIRATKKRIKELEYQLTKDVEAVLFSDEVWVVNDPIETNRTMIFFPGKPSEEVRKKLKSQYWRWSWKAEMYFSDGEERWNLSGAWQKKENSYYFKNAKELLIDLGYTEIKSIKIN